MHARCEDTIMILNTCENFLYTVDQDQIIKREKATLLSKIINSNRNFCL